MPDVKKTPQASEPENAAEALQRRRVDWAAGAEEGKALDRRIARQQTPQERLDAGRQLVDIATKLRREA